MKKLTLTTGLFLSLLVLDTSTVHAASITSDFSWFPSGQHSASTTLSDGTTVTFSSSAIPFNRVGTGGVGIGTRSGGTTRLTLSFDQEISDLRLFMNGLANWKYLRDFSVYPSRTDGTGFVLTPPTVYGDPPNRNDNLYWDSLNSNSVSFVLRQGCCRAGTTFYEFEFETVPPQPQPPTTTPEPSSILSLIAIGTFGITSTIKGKLKLSEKDEISLN